MDEKEEVYKTLCEWCVHQILSLIYSNPVRDEKSLKYLAEFKDCIREASVEELYEIIPEFITQARYVEQYGLGSELWVSELLEVILERPESLYVMFSLTRDKDTIEKLINPLIQRGILLPRELKRIENGVFSDQKIRRLIEGYTTNENIRNTGNRRLIPYRVLQNIHPTFSKDISDIVGGYGGLDVPVHTPRIHRPRQFSPRIYLSRPSGSRRSPNRRPSTIRNKAPVRSPNRRPSSTRSKPRRSKRK